MFRKVKLIIVMKWEYGRFWNLICGWLVRKFMSLVDRIYCRCWYIFIFIVVLIFFSVIRLK